MSSQYHRELSVNNLLSPPPPPPPALTSACNLNIEESFDNHSKDVHYDEMETQEYYGNNKLGPNYSLQQWQPEPPPPATSNSIYDKKKTRGSSPRPPFRLPIDKPTGLAGPWLANTPDKMSRKRPRPDSCDRGYSALLPVLIEEVEEVPSEDVPTKPSVTSTASLSPADVPMENSETQERVRLPAELTVLFGPLKCILCSVEVNSHLQAKMHYSGKIHEKKVAQYMQKWSNEKGEPVPKRYKLGTPKKKANLSEKELYCEHCDLALTSSQHAEQHYAGRNHKRAVKGNAPLKAGYFNKALGKWQRMPVVEPDPTGRFHIGKAFTNAAASTDPLGLKQELEAEEKPANLPSPFMCQLCHILTTSYDQLETHYQGAKHKKAMKNAGDSWSVDRQKIPAPVAPLDSILASLVPKDAARKLVLKPPLVFTKKDMSMYRTPSGQYYCKPCNITLNSEAQFSQHVGTKKHKLCLASVKKP